MKIFCLKISDGETINKVLTYNIDDAIEIFAITKQLTIAQLLKIFIVEELIFQ